MTKNEALSILKCNSEDEILDAYDQAIFDLKGKVLQIVPPLKLIQSIVKKMNRINEAYGMFNSIEEGGYESPNFSFEDIDLAQNLKLYQIELAKLRLAFSRCYNGFYAVALLQSIYNLQSNLFILLNKYCTNIIDEHLLDNIKISDSIDVFLIQKDLSNIDIPETEISEYIRTEINKKDFESYSELTKSVIKATKQVDFNGLN